MRNAKRLLACLVVCTMLVATLGMSFAFAEGDPAVKIEVSNPGKAGNISYKIGDETKTEGVDISAPGTYTITVEDTADYVAKIECADTTGIVTVVDDHNATVEIADGTTLTDDIPVTITFLAKKYVRYYEIEGNAYGEGYYTGEAYVWDTNTDQTQDLLADPAAVKDASSDYSYPTDKEFKYWGILDDENNLVDAGDSVTFSADYKFIDVYPVFKDTLAPTGAITVKLAQRTDNYETGKRLNGDLKKTNKFTTTFESVAKTWNALFSGDAKLGFIKNAFAAGEVVTDEDGYTVEVKAPETVPNDIVSVTATDPDTYNYEEVSGVAEVAIYVQTLELDEDGNAPKYLTETELGSVDWKALTLSDGKWVLGADADVEALTSDGIYAVYAKLTDGEGNAAYISTQGIMLDQTAPTIDIPEGEEDAGEDVDFWFGTGYTNLVVRDNLSGIGKIEYRVFEKIGIDQIEYVSDTTLDNADAIAAENNDDLVSIYGNDQVFTEGKFRIIWPTWGFYEILVWVTDNAGNISCYRIEVGDFPPIIIPVSVPIPIPIPIFIPDKTEPTTTPGEDIPPETGDSNTTIALVVAAASLALAGTITVIAKKRKVTE